MAIRYLPSKLLKRIAPKTVVEKLVTKDLTLNRTVATMLSRTSVLSKREIDRVALRVIKDYKSKYEDEKSDGASNTEAIDDALNDKKLMVARVQNAVVNEVTETVKSNYRGEYYIWLPSDANQPDPLHQLNYGQRFQIGKGEAPGDRYGCRCGMQILVDEDELELD